MMKIIAFLLVGLATQSLSAADQPLTYDRISLSVSATAEVENDILVAVLFYQREGSEPGKLADDVNQTIAWALERARSAAEIQVQTLDYHTSPIYSKQTLTGWRVRQAIQLKSKDAAQLSELIGALQERLGVQSVGYRVSPERRRTVEDRLISEALQRFRQRAQLIAAALGRTEYRLVQIDVSTSEAPPVRPLQFRSAALSAETTVAPPALEAGSETLDVAVHGTIELAVK
ncbi:MAG: SIMPL domain-containing protein [Desulfobacterales bacterium]|nr:MAG: SIMPL domain-containing protein [Desulfobacterales bacterium]